MISIASSRSLLARLCAIALIAAGAFGLSGPSLAQTSTPAPADGQIAPAQREAIEKIIRDYILNNPEVLIEALQSAEERMKAQSEQRAQKAIVERRKDLQADPVSVVVGNPDGDVTLVEFFDYRCPYCKQVNPALQTLLGEDKKLRVVYKEFPILGKESVFASRAAIAARKQGKYESLHNALMSLKGQLTEDGVLRAATSVGLDIDRLKTDMNAPDVELAIGRTRELAQALQIKGTPAFIIGDELLPGAVEVDVLRKKIAAARKSG